MSYQSLLAAALIAVTLGTAPARAAAVYTWSFDEDDHVVGPSGVQELSGTIVNTGTEAITRFVVAGTNGPLPGSLPGGDFVFGPPSGGIAPQFAGLNLAPGESFTFIFATITWSGSPPGTWLAPFSQPGLFLASAGQVTIFPIAATNLPTFAVIEPPAPIPAPAGAGLLLAGLLGLAATRRRG
jgi:hypothetical protein